MGLSLAQLLNPQAELNRRAQAEAEEKARAEYAAVNDALAQAMGQGPSLQSIAAMSMPALPERETSFDQPSRFGQTGTEEDYQRLFGPASQPASPALLQQIQQQGNRPPQADTPQMRYIKNMVNSDNQQVRRQGLELMREQLLAPPPEVKPAKAPEMFKIGDRWFYKPMNVGDEPIPVSPDALHRANNPLPTPEQPDSGPQGNAQWAQALSALESPDFNPDSPSGKAYMRYVTEPRIEKRPDGATITHPPMLTPQELSDHLAARGIETSFDPNAGREITAPPMSEKAKEKEAKLTRLERSAATYRALLEEHGTEGIPGQAKDDLASAHTDLLMQLKEAYKLGVLSGQDEALILKRLPDPTAWYNQLKDGKRLLHTFDTQLMPTIQDERNTWNEQYGDKGGDKSSAAPPPGFVED